MRCHSFRIIVEGGQIGKPVDVAVAEHSTLSVNDKVRGGLEKRLKGTVTPSDLCFILQRAEKKLENLALKQFLGKVFEDYRAPGVGVL